MSRYDKYKDSGIAWIGEIPEGWEVKRISNFYSVRNEKVSDKDYSALSVTMQGIVPQLENAAKTNDGDNRKLVKAGDFAINSRSDRRGSCGISKYDGSVSLINTVLEPRSLMSPVFYNWLFRSSLFSDEFYKWGHGIVDDLWTTRWQEMKNISIPAPSISEQQAIADHLDRKCAEIDELVALQETMIEELKAYKQSVITEVVTRGLNPDAPLRDSGIAWIGSIPAHWEMKRIKNICSSNNMALSDRTDKDYSFSYVDIGSVTYEKGITSSEIFTFGNAPSRARRLVKTNDIIVSTVRTYLRAIDIIDTEDKENSVYSTGFAILTPKNNIIPKFLIHLCRSEYFTHQVSIFSSGINYPSINSSSLNGISVITPPLQEQQAIADHLDRKCEEIDKLIAIKQEKIEQLKEYKKSVIFEYVTGKKRVQ